MIQFKQSPINIETNKVLVSDLSVNFHYQTQEFDVIDNGNNIALMPIDSNCYIIKNNMKFELFEIHFHRPSEHHVDSHEFDMEVHFLHRGKVNILVYSVLLKISENGNDFGSPFTNVGTQTSFDLKPFVPTECWDYHGSFTTSPFDEEVIWLVSQTVQDIKQTEADILNGYYPNNNRCLQPLNERVVYSLCDCNML